MNASRGIERYGFRCAFVVMAMVFAIASAPALHAQRHVDEERTFSVTPPASIAAGQTLRVTFVNVGSNPLEIVPCIFDGDGVHLKKGAPLTIASGQIRSLDLSHDEAAGRSGGGSISVRAGIHADPSHLRNLLVSAEVVEKDGRTSLYVPGLGVPPEPVHRGQATASLAAVGLAGGQALRVTYLNAGSNPLEIIPCIFDSEGEHLKKGKPLVLLAGQTRSMEVSFKEHVSAERSAISAQIRGAAHVRPGDLKNLVMVGEVIEESTRKSTVYIAPGSAKGFNPQPDPPREH